MNWGLIHKDKIKNQRLSNTANKKKNRKVRKYRQDLEKIKKFQDSNKKDK